jgi:hypothetical protein
VGVNLKKNSYFPAHSTKKIPKSIKDLGILSKKKGWLFAIPSI